MVVKNSKKEPTIIPLSLKYKPRTLDEVRGRDDIVGRIREFMDQGYVPNMLFEGTQGTGKTLIADLLMKEYLGDNYTRGNYLVIDASTNNSVEHTREVLVNYMKTSALNLKKKKVLLLDEVDNFSKPSQSTLRRPIEQTMNRCMVIMTCNYKDKLIQPLLSRFTIFHFGAIPKSAIEELIRDVIEGEDIEVDGDLDDIIDQIYTHGKGEIRYILNNFMEHARASGVLDQSIIDMVVSENRTFAEYIFSGKLKQAIEEALTDPRGSFSGAINYVLYDESITFSYPAKVMFAGWFADAMRDLTLGIPFPTVVQYISHRIHSKLTLPKKKKTNK